METSLNVYDYPSKPEKEEQVVKGTIHISYTFEMEVPKRFDREDILDDIKANIDDYIDMATDMTIEEIDI